MLGETGREVILGAVVILGALAPYEGGAVGRKFILGADIRCALKDLPAGMRGAFSIT